MNKPLHAHFKFFCATRVFARTRLCFALVLCFGLLFVNPSASGAQAQPDPDLSALPLLVNKDHPIEEDYSPEALVRLVDVCPADLVKIKGKDIQGDPEAVEALITMLRGAAADGIVNMQISAGYRSFSYQKKLFDEKVASLRKNNNLSKAKATSAANKTVALPGTSEHHTGLAFDITVPGTSFAGTAQAKWLHAHCHEYGYILRYQKHKESITGYLAEAWHFRYVGKEAAAIIAKNDWCLEEYIEQAGE